MTNMVYIDKLHNLTIWHLFWDGNSRQHVWQDGHCEQHLHIHDEWEMMLQLTSISFLILPPLDMTRRNCYDYEAGVRGEMCEIDSWSDL